MSMSSMRATPARTQAHSEVLLAEMARRGRTITETEAFGIARQSAGGSDEQSRRLECCQTAGTAPGAQ
ncbi:hypothetical protein SBA6_200032 [Candidatus Sulfopaludibacter sp. SbA6]|nr:hypothetical protein SBA6_200032 [Candidatus Sulfopaludibacter sp. SbA6]